MGDLIDTTEMYLRTVLELEEEGITPLRARIAERLHQSGPTVSQTVTRMQRDGLLTVDDERHLWLTDAGRQRAVAVMRKHRLAELLLVSVIGLDYEDAHAEACRWEHVMSVEVERKVYELLGRPRVSPYGNRIPGLGELDADLEPADPGLAEVALSATPTGRQVVIRRLSEHLQTHAEVIHDLHSAGVEPGASVLVDRLGSEVRITHRERTVTMPRPLAALVFVTPAA